MCLSPYRKGKYRISDLKLNREDFFDNGINR